MATTEHVTVLRGGGGRRALSTAVAVATSFVLATGALAIARGGDDAAPPPTFWGLVSVVGSEVDPPATVDDLAPRSDAIVLAHVTGVRAGRADKGFADPTPPLSTNLPASQTVFVDLTVSRVVSGAVAVDQHLDLEMMAPPAPLTLADVRALAPTEELLFFLQNSGARARAAGLGSRVGPGEDAIWHLASQQGVVSEGSTGLFDALDPNGGDVTFLRSLGTTLDAAVERTEVALR